MKSIIRAACAFALLSLTACAGSITTLPPPTFVLPTSSTAIAQDVAAVTNYTQQICSFVPDAEIVLAIATQGGGIYPTAKSVADAICNSFRTKAAMRGAAPMVGNVRVEGHFERKKKRR